MTEDLRGSFDSIEAGKGDVHQDETGAMCLAELDCLGAVLDFSRDLKLSSLFQNGSNAISYYYVVVDQQHVCWHVDGVFPSSPNREVLIL
jgi:hypothetical protein